MSSAGSFRVYSSKFSLYRLDLDWTHENTGHSPKLYRDYPYESKIYIPEFSLYRDFVPPYTKLFDLV